MKSVTAPIAIVLCGLLMTAFSSELPAQINDIFNYYVKPVAKKAQCEFPGCELSTSLSAVSGTWVTSDGTFNSTSTTTSIATINSYITEALDYPPVDQIFGGFWYRARMLNQRSESNTRVGIVFHYQGPGTFYEVSFSPTGSVFVREMTNGVSRTVATGTYSGGGQNKWFDVEVRWTAAETLVRVNGLVVMRGIKQDARTRGLVGLITRQTTARFDRLLVMQEYGDREFHESFSAGPPPWDVIKGNWNVVNGVYQNSAVEYGSIVTLPFFVGLSSWTQTQWFTLRARMLNPYGASGNRMGFVAMHGDGTYDEIVFGADGIARVNRVSSGTVIPLERAPYPFVRNQWFDVTFTGSAQFGPFDLVDVSVNGTPVFTRLEAVELRGPIGLVTNWTPGRFDDVWFCHMPCEGELSSETFVDRSDPNDIRNWSALRGSWDTQGDVLINRSAGASDIVYMTWSRGAGMRGVSTNYTVSARMLNPYGASGNRVGLIFNVDVAAGDYYEVVFATTGQAYINKFIQGQLTEVARAAHSAGRNVWFNVELTRKGPNATVKVNNTVVFENVPVAQLDHSFSTNDSSVTPRVGVISHWSPGRFDDLRFESLLGR
jgi:hypothetical protein